ncbi:MAG: hypothetical protein PHE55_19135 [Methylococcaceae bacterium]|nr:hypothetical protein [Methylococcaceae bacterium]
MKRFGADRVVYPDNHVEVDNRLSWFLGRLDREYGDDARYVHLRRERLPTALSYSKRNELGYIMFAYARGIYVGLEDELDFVEVGLDYYDTVNANIEAFLQNKSKCMDFALENAKDDFRQFWDWIEAEGDLDSALAEWDQAHNASA